MVSARVSMDEPIDSRSSDLELEQRLTTPCLLFKLYVIFLSELTVLTVVSIHTGMPADTVTVPYPSGTVFRGQISLTRRAAHASPLVTWRIWSGLQYHCALADHSSNQRAAHICTQAISYI
jgi:hypothetical protein